LDDGLRIVNTSNDTLFLIYSKRNSSQDLLEMLRTSKSERYTIFPNDTLPNDSTPLRQPYGWKTYIESCENSTMSIIAVKKKDFEQIPWDSIKNNTCLYEIYKLTIRKMDSLNWIFKLPKQ
jgi:hypothetical protein